MSGRKGIASLLVVALIALAVGIFIGYLIPTSATNPAITLSASSVQRGTQYSVTLSGFPANMDIYGWTVNQEPPMTFLAGTTDASGKLSLNSSAPQTPGNWLLCASDANNEYWAQAVLTVT